jgi:hypothetical protein
VAGPANAPTEPHRLRAAAGVDKPANVAARHAEQFGDVLDAEKHGGRVLITAGGRAAGVTRNNHG